MRTRIGVLAVLALGLMLSGCWEVKQKITLNPDASGKLAFDLITVPTANLSPLGGKMGQEIEDPQQAARDTVADLIHQQVKGVEAWKDLSIEVLKDGRIRFQGVAYFRDYAQLKAPWSLQGIKWQKVEGAMVLDGALEAVKKPSLPGVPPGMPGAPPATPTKPVEELTEKQLHTKILAARMSYQQGRGLMTAIMGSMKTDTTFMLPGKVVEQGAFQKTADGGLRVALEGSKMLQALDKLMADEKFLSHAVKAGEDPMEGKLAEKVMTQMVLGSDAPLRAKVTGELKPLFDYEAEMTNAKAAMAAMFGKLQIPLQPQRPAFPMPMPMPTLPEEDF